MIAVILTDSGSYNVVGICDDEGPNDGSFTVQGNMTRPELEELHVKIGEALSEK